MQKLEFYSYFRSSSAYRVRIALHYKNIPHHYHAIHLVKDGGEQNKAAFLKLNPLGEVPAIQDGDFVLTQSLAILLYLDERFPGPRLFPQDLRARSRMVQLCETINSGIQPLQNLRVQQELTLRFGADQNAKDEWTRFWIQRGFKGLEALLSETAGTYSVGGEFSAMDCFLVPQVFAAQRFGLNLSEYPTIQRVSENCLALDFVQKAHPSRQPDAV